MGGTQAKLAYILVFPYSGIITYSYARNSWHLVGKNVWHKCENELMLAQAHTQRVRERKGGVLYMCYMICIRSTPLQPETDQLLGSAARPLSISSIYVWWQIPLVYYRNGGRQSWLGSGLGWVLWVGWAMGSSVINEARCQSAPAAAAHLSAMFMKWLTAFVAPAIG